MRFLFFIAIFLTACTTTPPRAPVANIEQAWQERLAQLMPLQDWSLSARIAIRTHDDGWHGTLQWQQHPSRYSILFTAPLGQGSLQIEGDQQHGAQLRTDDKVYYANSAEELLHNHLGWHFPVEALRFWMIGLPHPNSTNIHQLDPYGRLLSLEQENWKVEFRRYGQVGKLELPEKIFISNHQLNLRLIVEQWDHIRT